MDDDFEPGRPVSVVRLFPLRDVVLFPHTILPLHIYEPRYRQMTEDALARDKTIAIVRLKPGPADGPAVPAIEDVACVGEIVRHQRMADGQFNILLAGRRRVRLRREVPSEKLYRIAEADVIEDYQGKTDLKQRRRVFVTLCHDVLRAAKVEEIDLTWLWNSKLSLGVVTDIAAAALALAPETRQALLAENRVDRRLETLIALLVGLQAGAVSKKKETRPFPPLFSSN
ncbi:MAG: LON peptidase substrate-binding domain-containing protein [Isosphaeraceae bacterium]|nr:LON peptidase substrate-binding domain-containing protein [Isosphaeraceae bacterium]